MGSVARSQPPERCHAMLEPRVKHVSEATIRKKWKRLPTSNHNAVREAVHCAKQQSRTRKGRTGTDSATEECVQTVATKLVDRLPRIPFPPATDEHHFDHEANLQRIEKIEEQLNANVHSMSLLKAQIMKEDKLLSQDEAEVNHLEQSLKSREAHRREQSRTLHPIAKNLGHDGRNPNLLTLQNENQLEPHTSITEIFEDEDMQPVLEHLYSHLQTMNSNVSAIKHIRQAVDSVEADIRLYALQYSNKREDDEIMLDQT